MTQITYKVPQPPPLAGQKSSEGGSGNVDRTPLYVAFAFTLGFIVACICCTLIVAFDTYPS